MRVIGEGGVQRRQDRVRLLVGALRRESRGFFEAPVAVLVNGLDLRGGFGCRDAPDGQALEILRGPAEAVAGVLGAGGVPRRVAGHFL